MGKNMTDFNFLINGAQYIPPSIPILLQILNGAVSPWQIEPKGSVYTLPKVRLIEITFSPKNPGRPHPFHLHGHQFAVIKSDAGQYRNYDKPIMRDTVSTGVADDEVVIRFITDNPGP
ncbi:Cupredoxin [Imleria badia]|nr:Cupredoxin [Imleria badia]